MSYIELQLEQGSEKWRDWRRSVITSTDAPVIQGVSPYDTLYSLFLKKVGHIPDETPDNPAMRKGRELEIEGRNWISRERNEFYVPTVIQSDHLSMGASLDGISFSGEKHTLEVKYMGPDEHELFLQGKIPERYYPQVQHTFAFAEDIHLCAFVSVCPEHTTKFGLQWVKRDKEFIDSYVPKALEFHNHVLNKCLPIDQAFSDAEKVYAKLHAEHARLTKMLDKAKEVLISNLTPGQKTTEGQYVRVTLTEPNQNTPVDPKKAVSFLVELLTKEQLKKFNDKKDELRRKPKKATYMTTLKEKPDAGVEKYIQVNTPSRKVVRF